MRAIKFSRQNIYIDVNVKLCERLTLCHFSVKIEQDEIFVYDNGNKSKYPINRTFNSLRKDCSVNTTVITALRNLSMNPFHVT